MKKQKIITTLLTIIITGAVLTAVPSAYAQAPESGTHPNFFQEIITFISQKFGLDRNKVQTAVEDFRKQKMASITPRPSLSPQQLADKEKTRLDQFVKQGKITARQETDILNELAALRTKYNLDTLRNLTPEQRKTQMQAMRDEILAFAKKEGVDSSYVMPGFGLGRGGGLGEGPEGRGKGWGRHYGNLSPTPAQ